jgi:hypothetical protein
MRLTEEAQKRGESMFVRRLPALDAIDEVIGRSAEMGRPVHYSPGLGTLTRYTAPQTLAAISILGHVAKLCASMGSELLVSVAYTPMLPLCNDVVRSAYLEEGKIDEYQPDNIQFIADRGDTFAAALIGKLRRVLPAANFYIGALFRETSQILETGYEVGAMQISGTNKTTQLPWMMMTCEYVLMNDEMFCADAYITRNPKSVGSIKAIDIGKILCIIGTILGTILETFGISFLTDILGV